VVIDLHGNGGQGNLQNLGRVFDNTVVLVAPDGYERSWNILKEKSKAPDVDFILDLIKRVGDEYPQANMSDVTIVGNSNGAGMIHRLLIEAPSPLTFHRVIPKVSSLGKWQFKDDSFWMRKDETSEDYNVVVNPSRFGPDMIYIHGTNDGAVPYDGGRGVLGMEFWGAQEATYIWARYWGEKTPVLGDDEGVPVKGMEDVFKYTYLGGQVVHYKVVGGDHGLSQAKDDVNTIIKNAVLGTSAPAPGRRNLDYFETSVFEK